MNSFILFLSIKKKYVKKNQNIVHIHKLLCIKKKKKFFFLLKGEGMSQFMSILTFHTFVFVYNVTNLLSELLSIV